MGFLDSFTGKSQAKTIARARQEADAQLAAGYDEASDIGRDYLDRSLGFVQPWMEAGGRANALYDNALGINGREAQNAMFADYQSDPFRAGNEERATEAIRRAYNSRGMDTSGNALLASARASQERGSQDWQQYLTRLQGQAGQGAGMAQYGAGLTSNTGNALMNMRYGYGQQRAGNAISAGNAEAQMQGLGWQNALNLAGTAVKAFAGWK